MTNIRAWIKENLGGMTYEKMVITVRIQQGMPMLEARRMVDDAVKEAEMDLLKDRITKLEEKVARIETIVGDR